ncbi:MAG: hypothetical protein RL011_2342 [Pseudomonadota bacterium]|jgi:hypothetical protein
MTQRKEAPAEIGMGEATSLLGMSEKTVRKYIKLKAIRAVKVANCWYVDHASLVSFQAKLNKANQLGDEAAAATSAAKTSGPQSPSPKRGEKSGSSANSSKRTALAGTAAVHNLACYRLFLAAREQLNVTGEAPELAAFVDRQCRDIIAHLGGGYYGYGTAKRIHYDKARSGIGSIIALLASESALYERHQRAAQFLERDVLPAFGSLMRKLDGRGSDPHRAKAVGQPR